MSSGAERILEEARRRAQEIVKEARAEAERIVGEAERRWLEKAGGVRRSIIEAAQREAGYLVAEAKREASYIIGRAKSEAVREALRRVEEIIRSSSYDVEGVLKGLIAEALEYVDDAAKVIVRPEHAPVAKKVLSELGRGGVEVELRDDMLGGAIVVSRSGLIVDNRLETRLRQATLRVMDKIARILWG